MLNNQWYGMFDYHSNTLKCINCHGKITDIHINIKY